MPRPETVQLFGGYLYSLRRNAGLSLDVFARGTTRNVDWVQSVERGACCPSRSGFSELELGFDGHEDVLGDVPLKTVFENLEKDPLSESARQLRQDYQLSALSTPHDAPDPDGLIPLLQDIAYQDRLLALNPLALLITLVAFFLVGRPWNGEGVDIDFEDLNFDGFAFVSLALERIYSVPEHWGVLKSTCLEVDLYERFILVLVLATCFGVWWTAVAMEAASSGSGWLPWVFAVLILAVITVAAYRRQQSLARAVATRLGMAYGIQPSPPEQLPGA